jgi:plastocyanin domain-containing protein
MKTQLSFAVIAAVLLSAATAAVAGKVPARAAKTPVRLELSVTSDGFMLEKGDPKLKAGQPVTLVVTRKVERTCATELVIRDYGINQTLPLNKPVEITFTPKQAGTIRYACAMDMIAGELIVAGGGSNAAR